MCGTARSPSHTDRRAIRFYVDGLGFTLVEDTPQGDKRWDLLQPAEADWMAAVIRRDLAHPARA